MDKLITIACALGFISLTNTSWASMSWVLMCKTWSSPEKIVPYGSQGEVDWHRVKRNRESLEASR